MLRMITTTAMLLGLSVTASAVSAQSLRNADAPAEFPPSSFTGKQYIDSRGCVFVRAGFDGAVTWVPRVNRQRKVLCGQQPTFAEAPKPDVPVVPDPPRVVTATPTPVPTKPVQTATVAPTVKPAPTVRTVTPTVKPAPTRVVTAPAVRTPTPSQVVVATPRPAPAKPAPVQPVVKPPQQVATACPGASALSQQYLTSGRPVRCGPQGTHPGTYGANGTVVASANPTQTVRVQPAPEIKPPEGYRAAYDDGRFNPNRGLQTREGHAQMRLVWTSGVPWRLVDQNSGRDVTGLFPNLRFPFISMKEQKRYVARHGWPAASTNSGNVTIATKNTPTQVIKPAPTTTRAPSGHRYVQVGTFSVEGNARNSAVRLQQLGLPVRIGTYKKSGKTYRVVLAGPFGNGNQLSRALSAARRAGFSDAFTRK